MRALRHLASLALAAAILSGSSPACLANVLTHPAAPAACPAGTNWNHVLQQCV